MLHKWLTKDPDWVLTKRDSDKEETKLNETLFTLGNGYIGSRGVFIEGSKDAYPGTYISGIYNRMKDEPAEIVNCPNPLRIVISIDGIPLSRQNMHIKEHIRQLDVKKALLYRKTHFEFQEKDFLLETFRFFSMNHMHFGVMCFSITPLTHTASIVVKRIIDGAQENEMRAEQVPLRHFKITEKSGEDAMAYLEAKTKDMKQTFGMAVYTETDFIEEHSKHIKGDNFSGTEFSFMAEKQVCYGFTSYLSIFTSRDVKNVKKACLSGIEASKKHGFNELIKKHVSKWDEIWENCDIVISGDKRFQFSVRFNAYQLIIASPQEDIDSSIPAKTLSGDWYKGHVFWDTEIYAFPFFNYTQPKVARNLLMYRARRLEAARKGAEYQDYDGALWPWESAQTGVDETPDTWVNFDGSKIPVYNKYREHHIAADVIYALIQYYIIHDDTQFMLDYGLEMVLSTARFLASRVDFNKTEGIYEIKNVVGPNEFQECVNNNSYTNYMARFVLKYALELIKKYANKHPAKTAQISNKLKLRKEEIENWAHIKENMAFLQNETGLIEEFEGYFKKQDVVIRDYDENGMPVWPEEIDYNEVKFTQLVKQADVVLLLYLFSSEFSQQTKRINYDYYLPRTTHKSSLSVPIYMILAIDIGLIDQYEQFFTQVFNSDLINVHGNTDQGIHAASLGGAWQVIANGFGGISIKDDVMHLKPRLPKKWEGLKFRVWFREAQFELDFMHSQTVIRLLRSLRNTKKDYVFKIDDEIYTLNINQLTAHHNN